MITPMFSTDLPSIAKSFNELLLRILAIMMKFSVLYSVQGLIFGKVLATCLLYKALSMHWYFTHILILRHDSMLLNHCNKTSTADAPQDGLYNDRQSLCYLVVTALLLKSIIFRNTSFKNNKVGTEVQPTFHNYHGYQGFWLSLPRIMALKLHVTSKLKLTGLRISHKTIIAIHQHSSLVSVVFYCLDPNFIFKLTIFNIRDTDIHL